jgi:hypothetical protein
MAGQDGAARETEKQAVVCGNNGVLFGKSPFHSVNIRKTP